MDFAADNAFLLAELANATVAIGADTFRAIYDAPGKMGGAFGESMQSTDPQMTILQSDAAAYEVRNGTVLVLTPDLTDSPLDYIVKQALPDGAGLTICTLKRG